MTAQRAPRRRFAANPVLVDWTIALGLTSLSLLALGGGAANIGERDPLSVTLLLLETLPLVARRRFPVAVLAVTFGATLGHVLIAPEGATVNESFGSLVALYSLAERRERRISLSAAILMAALFGTVFYVKGGLPEGLQGLIQTTLTVGLAWALGDLARTRRLVGKVMEDRARMLEAEREERARRAVAAERERIARELHDIVAHHVSVIVIQAGAALRAIDRDQDGARTAIEAVDRTGRLALADMRRMLGILGDGAPSSEGALAPLPGLDRLGELVEEVRSAGLPVELSVQGERRQLDAGIDLSAYRIVQEALTNVLKHAIGARARIDLRYAPQVLEIEVVDEGGSGTRDVGDSTHAGRGLIGMRERAAVFGGRLEAGPTPTGFRVMVSLPIEPSGTTAA